MNAVRVVYLVCTLIETLALLLLAMIVPVWITPGYYWWTVVCFVLLAGSGHSFTKRVNDWGILGRYDP
jgi:hypothetical protein